MKKFFVPVVALIAAAVGCQSGGTQNSTHPGTKTTVAGLTNFLTCEALGDFLESKVGSKSAPVGSPTVEAPSEDNASAGGTAGEMGDAAPTASPTTTVEEADIVKQDGNRLYV